MNAGFGFLPALVASLILSDLPLLQVGFGSYGTSASSPSKIPDLVREFQVPDAFPEFLHLQCIREFFLVGILHRTDAVVGAANREFSISCTPQTTLSTGNL